MRWVIGLGRRDCGFNNTTICRLKCAISRKENRVARRFDWWCDLKPGRVGGLGGQICNPTVDQISTITKGLKWCKIYVMVMEKVTLEESQLPGFMPHAGGILRFYRTGLAVFRPSSPSIHKTKVRLALLKRNEFPLPQPRLLIKARFPRLFCSLPPKANPIASQTIFQSFVGSS